METWREIQKNNFRDWKALKAFLRLDECPLFFKHPLFPLNLPVRLAKKIEKGNVNDPILIQFLPKKREKDSAQEGYSLDPVSDRSFQKTPRLLHKYPGRVLLVVTGACAMHCRFCFRQHYPYNEGSMDFSKELQIIANDPSIYEVILSGGDPLSISDNRLSSLVKQLSDIPHLKILRFHTRFPVGIPERITPTFLTILANTPLQVVFVLHINHPKEFDEEIFKALKKIQSQGIPILTQTVLLRKVNDNLNTLKLLCLTSAKRGIIPYYLHQLDQVQGTLHFEVSKEKGVELIRDLRKALPGYAVPTYVQEIPHRLSKTEISHQTPVYT